MRFIYIFLIILISTIPIALADDYFDKSSAIIDVSIEGGLIFTPTGNNPSISQLVSKIFLLPDDERIQRVLKIEPYSYPESRILYMDNSIDYVMENLDVGEITIGANYRVESRNFLHQISEQKSFPYDTGMSEYLKPTKFIDITPEIKELANEISQGNTDYYSVIHDLGVWVGQNIQYNLSTLTENVVQKSSWVLEHRQGVCSELTNLFISFCRSLGIPARFVSGMAYSNVIEGFGPHGWAEVYYPGYGWIPVDVTYKQIGWLDPTHVKLQHSLDSGEPSMDFSWRARDVEATVREINISSELISVEDIPYIYERIKVQPLLNNIGPGSYTTIEVEITNPTNFYLPISLFVVRAPQRVEDPNRLFLLKPQSSTRTYFVIQVPEDIEPNLIYLAPFEVKTNNGARHSADIFFKHDGIIHSRQDAEELISKEEIKKEFFKDIDINCSLDKNIYYSDDIIVSSCSMHNIGNTPTDVKLCSPSECEDYNLLINEEKLVSFQIKIEDTYRNTVNMDYFIDNKKYSETLPFRLVQPAEFNLEIESPRLSYYSEQLVIYVDVNALIKNLTININNIGELSVNELNEGREFTIPISAKKIHNNIEFEIQYFDEGGKLNQEYFVKEIEITDKPFFVRMYRRIRNYIFSIFL